MALSFDSSLPMRRSQNDEDTATARRQIAQAVAFDLGHIVQALIWCSGEVQAASTPEERQAALEYLGAHNERLMEYVDHLRLVAALEAGALHLQSQMLDLCALSRQALDDVAAVAQSLRIRFHLDATMPVHAWADATVLRRVMAMLIHNAMRHLNLTERRITLHCSAHGNWVRWSCTDTGVGLAAADVLRLNRRLDRLARGSVDLTDSLGMGLNICARFVGAMQGRLQITSAGQGHGTTVLLTLPAHAEEISHDC